MKIRISNLEKNFNNQQVLKNLNATFYDGEVNIIIGESGSGKTTLLNIIALFERPDDGEIYFDGEIVSKLSEKEKQKLIRQKIGYIYQDIRIFEELTVYENIKLALEFSSVPKSQYRNKIAEILEILKMNENSNQICSSLSGGEKQRVAIGRTVASEKLVIFADEPTGALDRENTQVVIDLLKKINRDFKTTIIMITHSDQVSGQFEHQFLLESGVLNEKNT
jgi:ABC-type lipoprotein export system ATPase subunit